MSNKYTFYKYGDDSWAVEIPKLDAFISDITEVCAKHGIGFNLERGYGDDSSTEMTLVPFEQADFDFIHEDLDEYGGGIPWLDEARTEWYRRKEATYAAKRLADQAAAQQARQDHEAAVLRDGVVVGGKRYKLVEE